MSANVKSAKRSSLYIDILCLSISFTIATVSLHTETQNTWMLSTWLCIMYDCLSVCMYTLLLNLYLCRSFHLCVSTNYYACIGIFRIGQRSNHNHYSIISRMSIRSDFCSQLLDRSFFFTNWKNPFLLNDYLFDDVNVSDLFPKGLEKKAMVSHWITMYSTGWNMTSWQFQLDGMNGLDFRGKTVGPVSFVFSPKSTDPFMDRKHFQPRTSALNTLAILSGGAKS